jgi:carbonic anhydrase
MLLPSHQALSPSHQQRNTSLVCIEFPHIFSFIANSLAVTCMDARIDPAAAYGINLGDAHVVRNAGGNTKDALRSIVISQQLLGTNEIIVVKHTGCGMLTFDNATAQGIIEKNLGQGGKDALSAFNGDFQAFPDLESAVTSDVDLLKSSPLVAKDTTISGWVYEVETGKVRHIV